jgi:quercetin dioxygenase-like cupin family protein
LLYAVVGGVRFASAAVTLEWSTVMSRPANAYRAPSYTVKSVETIADGTDVRVRLFTLASGEIIPWHYHSQCSDHYFVLQGTLSVETRNPEAQHALEAGVSHRLQPGMPHQICNRSETDCRFLLVQGVGVFDWVKVETA